jgi:hypothetical protein
MNEYDDEYLLILDLRELVKDKLALEVLTDFKKYFPDEYDQFLAILQKVETRKNIAALFK